MKLSNRIIEWVATVIVQLIVGVGKPPGNVAVPIPKMPLLKEWTHNHLFFHLWGVVLLYVTAGDGTAASFGPC